MKFVVLIGLFILHVVQLDKVPAVTSVDVCSDGCSLVPLLLNGWHGMADTTWSTPRYYKEEDGLVILHGIITGGPAPAAAAAAAGIQLQDIDIMAEQSIIAILPIEYRSTHHIMFPVLSSPEPINGSTTDDDFMNILRVGRLDIVPSGHIRLHTGFNSYLSLDGISFYTTTPPPAVALAATTPVIPFLLNNWQPYHDHSHHHMEYSKPAYFMHNGRVHLQGVIYNGTTRVIMILPQEYQPVTTMTFSVLCASDTTTSQCSVSIEEDGHVVTSMHHHDLSNMYITLDGISFWESSHHDSLIHAVVERPWFSVRPVGSLIDVNGIVHLEGSIQANGFIYQQLIMILPQLYRPNQTMIFYVTQRMGGSAAGRLDITPNGHVIARVYTAVYVQTLNLNGITFKANNKVTNTTNKPVVVCPPGCGCPEFRNGWHAYGVDDSTSTSTSMWSIPRYYKDKDGTVHLQGLITGGPMSQHDITTKTQIIFILPQTYRPSTRHVFKVISSYHHLNHTVTHAPIPSRIDIFSNGRVSLYFGFSSGYLSLDGISFVATPSTHIPLIPSLFNPWSPFNSFYELPTLGNGRIPYPRIGDMIYVEPYYYKDDNNMIHLHGVIGSELIDDDEYNYNYNTNRIMILPQEYRPSRRHTFSVLCAKSSNLDFCTIEILSDGFVNIIIPPNQSLTQYYYYHYLSLEGITFMHMEASHDDIMINTQVVDPLDYPISSSLIHYLKTSYHHIYLFGHVQVQVNTCEQIVLIQLPMDYHPNSRFVFCVPSNFGRCVRVDIMPSGHVIAYIEHTDPEHQPHTLTLDGVHFPTNPRSN